MMADLANIAGGLGEAIQGGVSGLIQAKADKRITDRQDQLWNEQQDTKAAQDILDAGNMAQLRDPNIHPVYQLDQWAQDIQKQASQPAVQPAQSAGPVATPVPAAGGPPPLAQALG